MTPTFMPITRVRRETHDVVTFDLTPPQANGRFRFAPGQFNMLYLPGVGEAAISISGDPAENSSVPHTIRQLGC